MAHCKGNHHGQEIERERLSLSDNFVWLRCEPRALHLRRALRVQGWLHLHEGLQLLGGKVSQHLGR
jgi:hypothetical protein